MRAEKAQAVLSERVESSTKNRDMADIEIFVQPRGPLEYTVYFDNKVLVGWSKRPLQDSAKAFLRHGYDGDKTISMSHGNGPVTILTTLAQAIELNM